jgi:hypothetical protein
MIKNFFSSKIIATASGETVVIGLKLGDAEGFHLRLAGIILAMFSAAILLICWISHSKNEGSALTTPAPARKHNRRNRSHVSRAN